MSPYALTIISVVYDVGLLAFSTWWLFTIQTYYDQCCIFFLLPLLTLIATSFSQKNLDRKHAAVKIKINLATLGLVVLIASARYYWDFNFILHSKEYASALETVKASEIDFSQDSGYKINLPLKYRHLTINGDVVVKRNNGKISIIFPLNQGDLDGILDAYVFAEEKQSNGLPEICGAGHSINPPNENWYYCTAAERQIHE
jgi:hypothetical protein